PLSQAEWQAECEIRLSLDPLPDGEPLLWQGPDPADRAGPGCPQACDAGMAEAVRAATSAGDDARSAACPDATVEEVEAEPAVVDVDFHPDVRVVGGNPEECPFCETAGTFQVEGDRQRFALPIPPMHRRLIGVEDLEQPGRERVEWK